MSLNAVNMTVDAPPPYTNTIHNAKRTADLIDDDESSNPSVPPPAKRVTLSKAALARMPVGSPTVYRNEHGFPTWQPHILPKSIEERAKERRAVDELAEALRKKLNNRTPHSSPAPTDADNGNQHGPAPGNPAAGAQAGNEDALMGGGQHNAPPIQQNIAPPALPNMPPNILPGQAATPLDAYPGNWIYEAGLRGYIPESHQHLLDDNGGRRVLMWLWGDHSNVDPVWKRNRMVTTLRTLTSDNPMLVPVPIVLGNHSLGTVHGRPPTLFTTSDLSVEDYDRLLSLPCRNTTTFTVFVSPHRIIRMMRPLQLRGIIEVEYSEDNATMIVTAIRETLANEPRVWQAMDMYHSRAAPEPWAYERATAIDTMLNSLRPIARPLPNEAGTEWSLEWDCPSYSWDGERHWVDVLRSMTLPTAFGNINITQAPIVWCSLCYSMDHTNRVCPWPDTPGWIAPPPPPTVGGNGGGRGRGRGGRGGPRGGGRGFGGFGGRGGRGRGGP